MTNRATTANKQPVKVHQAADATPLNGTAVVAFVALFDSAAPLGYLFLGTAHPIHASTIAFKLIALLVIGRRGFLSRPVLLWFAVVLFLFLEGIALEIANFGTLKFESTRYLAVMAHVGLTLLLIPSDRFRLYAKWVVVLPLLTFLTHIVLVHLGQIQNSYGRWLYLGNSHPNLGGEIGAAVVLAAALSLKVRYFIPVATIIGYSCLLMETRAALLAICLLTLGRLWLSLSKIQRSISTIVVVTVIPALLVVDVLASNGLVNQIVNYVLNDIFLADNPYRGLGTGFVGRELLWVQTWHLFEQHPFTGVGIAYFMETGTSGPHNAFLYGLSLHGIWSLPFWGAIFYMTTILILRSFRDGFLIVCMFPLLMLNDRFINMNPYPSFFYLFLFFAYQCFVRPGQGPSIELERPSASKANKV